MPTDHPRADAATIREAAEVLHSGTANDWADLTDPHVRAALVDLLDSLAEHASTLGPVRWQAVQSARTVVGRPMESPTIRRTRRR